MHTVSTTQSYTCHLRVAHYNLLLPVEAEIVVIIQISQMTNRLYYTKNLYYNAKDSPHRNM